MTTKHQHPRDAADWPVWADVRFLREGDDLPRSIRFGGVTADEVNGLIEGFLVNTSEGGILDDAVLDDWSPRTVRPEDLGFTTTRRNLE